MNFYCRGMPDCPMKAECTRFYAFFNLAFFSELWIFWSLNFFMKFHTLIMEMHVIVKYFQWQQYWKRSASCSDQAVILLPSTPTIFIYTYAVVYLIFYPFYLYSSPSPPKIMPELSCIPKWADSCQIPVSTCSVYTPGLLTHVPASLRQCQRPCLWDS